MLLYCFARQQTAGRRFQSANVTLLSQNRYATTLIFLIFNDYNGDMGMYRSLNTCGGAQV